jgi:hypothetical protein
LAIVFFVFSIASFFIAKSRYSDLISHDSAVILVPSAEVKNSPAESGIKLFILHEGAKVSVPEVQGEWVRVELSSDKVGWVKKSQLDFI